MSLRFDALKRADGASKLGDHHYVPVLHNHGDKVGRQQKLLLAVLGLVPRPRAGAAARRRGWSPAAPRAGWARSGWTRSSTGRRSRCWTRLKRLQAGGEPPRLTLNKHCQVCEFRQRCRKQAEEADDISLLGGVGEKELQQVQPQGHLHPDAAVLHLPPAEEGQAGQADGLHPLPRLAGPGHPREEGPRLRHAGPARRSRCRSSSTRRATRTAASSTCSASSSSRATAQKMHSFWADWPGPGGAGVRRLPGPAGRPRGLRPVPLRQLREDVAASG